ncbi:MAG: MOSC domain-containing protein [Actinomycetota bacterium]
MSSQAGVAGRVVEVFIARRGGQPVERVDEIEAIKDRGLAGDRFLEGTSYWSGVDECQVTLIALEALEHIQATSEVSVMEGQHRRNIVTRGVDLPALRGTRFRVGEATLEFDRPRPPCRYIQSVSEHGMTKALGRGRGGICARIIEGGLIRPGDAIEVVGKSRWLDSVLGS